MSFFARRTECNLHHPTSRGVAKNDLTTQAQNTIMEYQRLHTELFDNLNQIRKRDENRVQLLT
jgi:hypothetical protein